LNPFPANLGAVLANYRQVLVPENNMGHLCGMIRQRFLVDAVGLSKVEGRPFRIREVLERIEELLGEQPR
jgi:2-oxoglutarate/2-oxoacid ferredoxin oxidoreductase subunit alpha